MCYMYRGGNANTWWCMNCEPDMILPDDGTVQCYMFEGTSDMPWGSTTYAGTFMIKVDDEYVPGFEIFTNAYSSKYRTILTITKNGNEYIITKGAKTYHSGGIGLGQQLNHRQIMSIPAYSRTKQSEWVYNNCTINMGNFLYLDGKEYIKTHKPKINKIWTIGYARNQHLLVIEDSASGKLISILYCNNQLPVYSSTDDYFIIEDNDYSANYCYVINPIIYNTTDWIQGANANISINKIAANCNSKKRQTKIYFNDIVNNVKVSTQDITQTIGNVTIEVAKTHEQSEYFDW